MSRLRKNISANFLSSVWSTLLALLFTPVYVRFLGVESYGLIGFYLSWVAILGVLDTGISAAAMRQIAWLNARAEEQANIPSLLRSMEIAYWLIVLSAGMLILLAAIVFGGRWFQSETLAPGVVRQALMLMAISLIAQVPAGLYVSGLMGLQRQVEASILLAVFGTLRAVGAVFALWAVAPDIRVFFAWQFLISLLQTAVIRFYLWRRIRVPGSSPRFSLAMLRSVRAFAGGIIAITVLSVIMTQADKVILSRIIPLRAFGFYVLAWTVASGLSRIATPLVQAYSPRFTEFASRDDMASLMTERRTASQLMLAMIFPPAALIAFAAQPIIAAWTGDIEVARGTAPIVAVVIVGTALAACAYPALSVLYARHRLRPVVVINLILLAVWLPLLIVAALRIGAIGAAYSWLFYGLVTYFAYQAVDRTGADRDVGTTLRDLIVPAALSSVIAWLAASSLEQVRDRPAFAALLVFWLLVGWAATFSAVRKLRMIVIDTLKWQVKPGL